MNRFKIRNESNVARKLRFDRSPPAADAPGARMPKGQVPWASDKQRLAGGFGSMVDFFSPPPKPPQVGRPAGVPRKKRGRPPAAPVVGAADQNPSVVVVPTPVVDTTIAPPAVAEGALGFPVADVAQGSPAPKAKVKAIKAKVATRTNWGEGEALAKLTRAVADWDAKEGTFLDEEDMTLLRFCQLVDIPYGTLSAYVCKDLGKRKVLGSSVGRAQSLDRDTTQFVVDVLRRQDRGNAGLNRRESIDMIGDLKPGLTRRQAAWAFDNAVRGKHKDELTGIIKANASTEKRSAITVQQQFRWHSAVDGAFALLRQLNTGLTPSGQTFGEVMPHFVIGGDETCLLASAGDVKIVGDKEKKHHDVTTGSSRTSITLYRTGSAAGTDGPTAFLPPGVRVKSGFTDEFLVKNGAAPGSTIVMTPTGYMTEDAWVELAPKMGKGIRTMPVICENPNWWVCKIIDGFGPHVSSEAAMQIYYDHKIILLKEEGDSSHVNQAYDQEVAKSDKRSMRDALGFLRSSNKLSKSTIDGWQLIHVGLACCRELLPEVWVYSFKKVNLHPHHRVNFDEWCKRISHFLQGGEGSFKPEVARDEYALLPAFWHGMEPAEKKLAASILKSHANSFTMECLRELHSKVHVPFTDMQHLRVCLELAAEDPSHLERRVPEKSTLEACAEVVAARKGLAGVAAGLVTFQLHPTKADGTQLLSGMAKFEHMTKMARRSVPVKTDLIPSQYLDVEVSPAQRQLLNPKAIDYMMHEIAKQAHGEGAKQGMAKRKLDSLGNIRGDCGFANDPERMKRLKSQLQLADSLAEISKETAEDKATKTSLLTAGLIEKAPAAILKLKEKNGDPMLLTIAEMSAVAFVSFNGAVLKGDKASHARALSALMKAQPTIIILPPPGEPLPLVPTPSALTRTGPAPAAARAAKGTKRASESENESSDDEDSEDESSDDEAPPGYNVAKILAQKGKGKELRFLVDWEGFSEDDRTWEPLANIKNCDAYKAWLKK